MFYVSLYYVFVYFYLPYRCFSDIVTERIPNRIINGLNYMFTRAHLSRAPFAPHPGMTNLEDSYYGRYAPSGSYLVGVIKNDCITQWVLTAQRLLYDSQKCIPGRSGLCDICPSPKYEVCDLSDKELDTTWGNGSVCIYDKLADMNLRT